MAVKACRMQYWSFSSAGWFCRLGERAERRPVSVLRLSEQWTRESWSAFSCSGLGLGLGLGRVRVRVRLKLRLRLRVRVRVRVRVRLRVRVRVRLRLRVRRSPAAA